MDILKFFNILESSKIQRQLMTGLLVKLFFKILFTMLSIILIIQFGIFEDQGSTRRFVLFLYIPSILITVFLWWKIGKRILLPEMVKIKPGQVGVVLWRGELLDKHPLLEAGEHSIVPLFNEVVAVPYGITESISVTVDNISVNLSKKSRAQSTPVKVEMVAKVKTLDPKERILFIQNPETSNLKDLLMADLADKTRAGLSRKTYDEIDTNRENGKSEDEVTVAILYETAKESGGFYRIKKGKKKNGGIFVEEDYNFFTFDKENNIFKCIGETDLPNPSNGDLVIPLVSGRAMILDEILVKECLSTDKEFLRSRNLEFETGRQVAAKKVRVVGDAQIMKAFIEKLKKAGIITDGTSESERIRLATLAVDLIEEEKLYDFGGLSGKAPTFTLSEEIIAKLFTESKKGGKK